MTPPSVNLHPAVDWPETANVMVTGARVAAVLQRIAADLDELARGRRISDLQAASDRSGGMTSRDSTHRSPERSNGATGRNGQRR